MAIFDTVTHQHGARSASGNSQGGISPWDHSSLVSSQKKSDQLQVQVPHFQPNCPQRHPSTGEGSMCHMAANRCQILRRDKALSNLPVQDFASKFCQDVFQLRYSPSRPANLSE
ncbi:Uncharacterized protein DAT39_014381 [Clarias magur]|uniref:Uncharacterized protein n=1 Tax=Clarias magur TaxID=1594786 RepID=A0A8J4TR86_CLAMG|nr:Uncharacterized protein DAT39_014381 [Clarias magur]